MLVTSGSQQALTLVATVLLEPGDVVLVEEPSYLAALQAFQLAGARVVPVACDDDGLDPDALAAAATRRERADALHDPDVPQPDRTHAAARAARRAGRGRRALRVLAARGRPVRRAALPRRAAAGLGTLAPDRTLCLSTLSKVAAPGLRIGWIRTPASLRSSLVVAKQAADLHSSTIDQAAAARWLATVDLDAHIARLRDVYGARRDALLEGLLAALPPGSIHNRPDGGMFVWARLPDGWDAEDLLTLALARDVAFVPGYPFFAGEPDRATLRFSFTTHSPDEIAEGLARLHDAWH